MTWLCLAVYVSRTVLRTLAGLAKSSAAARKIIAARGKVKHFGMQGQYGFRASGMVDFDELEGVDPEAEQEAAEMHETHMFADKPCCPGPCDGRHEAPSLEVVREVA